MFGFEYHHLRVQVSKLSHSFLILFESENINIWKLGRCHLYYRQNLKKQRKQKNPPNKTHFLLVENMFLLYLFFQQAWWSQIWLLSVWGRDRFQTNYFVVLAPLSKGQSQSLPLSDTKSLYSNTTLAYVIKSDSPNTTVF